MHPILLLPPDYGCALLWPVRHKRAATDNPGRLGPMALGVEVSEPELAACCGLGNIDPQHNAGSDTRTAIEAALDWPLPPEGALLVTIRADADAIGAMAVLLLRGANVELGPAARARIAEIARWDRYELGSWHEWRRLHPPLPPVARSVDLGGPPLDIAAIAATADDALLPVEDRVRSVASWLLSGRAPTRGVAEALDRERSLLAAWNDGAISIAASSDPRLVLVRARAAVGLRFGYRFAPVVAAEGVGRHGRKLTLAQFEPGWIDLAAAEAALSGREPGWGGSATIIGSPQGIASGLTLEEVAGLALTFLRRPLDRQSSGSGPIQDR